VDQGLTKTFAGEYDIAPDGNAPETVAACLDVKVSTWIGGPVGSALDDYQAGQVEQLVSAADAEGGHAREVVGYRLNAKGELEFLIENSWGSSWGEGGYSWASSGVITGAWSLLPFQVGA
jgi:C1A family cysteine protease